MRAALCRRRLIGCARQVMHSLRSAGATHDTRTPVSLPYRADIDGLRAVAVILVVGFHAFPTLFRGGFVGVDVFFVISGYLISAVVLRQVTDGSQSLAGFYARRVRRILPALLLVLVACTAAGWALYVPFEFQRLGRHVAAGAGFFSNVLLWQESGYFDTASRTKPLLHLWSLAVEEQFYLAWPALLVVLTRRRWSVPVVLFALALSSLLYAQHALDGAPAASFYSPLARMWELMIGACIAVCAGAVPLRWASAAGNGLIAGAGLVFIGAAAWALDAKSPFPGIWALGPTLGAACVILAGPDAWTNRRLLAARPMVLLGRLSYPLYLWHWPLLVFPQLVLGHEPGRVGRIFIVLASVLLAWLTWRWLEQPLQRQPLRRVATVLVSACLCIFGLGLWLAHGGLLPRHADPSLDAAVAAAADWEFPGAHTISDMGGTTVAQSAPGAARSVLLVGDSHVQQYGPRLAALAAAQPAATVNAIVASSPGCPPIPDVFEDGASHLGCANDRSRALSLAFSETIDTVLVGACWACYFIDETRPAAPGNSNRYYLMHQGRRVDFRDTAGPPLAMDRLEALLRQLVKSKRRVYLLLDNPRGSLFDPMASLEGSRLGRLTLPLQARTAPLTDEEARLNQSLAALAARTGTAVISPIAALCRNMECLRTLDNGSPLYKDSGHLRASFVRDHAGYIDVALSPP